MADLKLVTVLLVEDNEVDVEAVRRAFKRKKIANPVCVAGNGIEALELLRTPEAEGGVPRPYIVLLDLNMPQMNGIEFLTEVRKDPELRKTVVFVLTTSEREEDLVASYELNVAGYAVKSQVGDDFQRLVGLLDAYWQVVKLPEDGPPCEG